MHVCARVRMWSEQTYMCGHSAVCCARDVRGHASGADRAIRISTVDHCLKRVTASLTLRLPAELAIINSHCHGNEYMGGLCVATGDVQATGPGVTGPQRAFRPALTGRRCGLTFVSHPRSL